MPVEHGRDTQEKQEAYCGDEAEPTWPIAVLHVHRLPGAEWDFARDNLFLHPTCNALDAPVRIHYARCPADGRDYNRAPRFDGAEAGEVKVLHRSRGVTPPSILSKIYEYVGAVGYILANVIAMQ